MIACWSPTTSAIDSNKLIGGIGAVAALVQWGVIEGVWLAALATDVTAAFSLHSIGRRRCFARFVVWKIG